MTTATATPFVSTPFGVGVVEIFDLASVFVRFHHGGSRWVSKKNCTFDAPRPDWYREPETALLAGYVS